MKKRTHSYFKDDIRRMLLLYAFLPAMVLTFLLLFMFFFYWNMELKNTVEAENGEEGLEKILDLKPDVVLTDIRMPKLDGITMIEKAKKELKFHRLSTK